MAFLFVNQFDLSYNEPDASLNAEGAPHELHLMKAAVTSVIWCSGVRGNFGWLHLNVFDERGQPKHTDGTAAVLGPISLVSHGYGAAIRGIIGVGDDSRLLAESLRDFQGYMAGSVAAGQRTLPKIYPLRFVGNNIY